MDPKLLTESGLKAVLSKHKIKDNGLQRALAAYDKLDDDAHDDCLETIAQIGKLAAALKKVKEVAANDAVVEYLEDLLDAADSEEKEVTKAKAAAEKEASKKGDQDEDEGEEEEEEEGEYADRLLSALKKLKSMSGKPMKYLVCDARPFCGLMVARRISPKHKEELTELTGGSKKFLHIGECNFENGAYVFTSEQSVPGLARRLQKAVKNHTGKKFKFAHCGETVEEDDESEDVEQPEAGAAVAESSQPAAPLKPGSPALAGAPGMWHETRHEIETRIGKLKAAVLKDLADEGPDFLSEITQNMARFDEILSNLDHRLAESLTKAHEAQSPEARQSELTSARGILKDYLKYVKSEEELLAHIDDNPFGVETNLKQLLMEKLAHMVKTVG